MGSNKQIGILVFLMTAMNHGQAQNFDEWFHQKKTQIKYLEQQIAALEVYDQLLQEGYGAVQGGLKVIGDIKQGDLDLHHDYFASLKTVNISIGNDPQTRSVKEVYGDILQLCAQVIHQSISLPATEKSHVRSVIDYLQTSSGINYRQYQLLMSNDYYQFSDDERLKQINNNLKDLHDQYAFIQHFQHQLAILRTQEGHEQSDISILHQLYNY